MNDRTDPAALDRPLADPAGSPPQSPTATLTVADRDNGLVVARHAIVSDHALQWPEAITAAEKASAIAQLKALGVLVRQGV